jgi:hypothetical protein
VEPRETEDFDWLSRNLIAQYWKGEKLDVETGKYRSCQLNNNWYSLSLLSSKHNNFTGSYIPNLTACAINDNPFLCSQKG